MAFDSSVCLSPNTTKLLVRVCVCMLVCECVCLCLRVRVLCGTYNAFVLLANFSIAFPSPCLVFFLSTSSWATLLRFHTANNNNNNNHSHLDTCSSCWQRRLRATARPLARPLR